MKIEYTIEQYPKFKEVYKDKLNEYQIYIRDNQKKYKYGKTKTCTKCNKKLGIKEFYVRDKVTGRRNGYCRDCQMRMADVIEIGKIRFAKHILKKGFRRCSVCKDIKPLSDYTKNISVFGGHSNNCYECSKKNHSEFIKKQRQEVGDFYVRQYGLTKGVSDFTDEIMDKLRNEIIENRKPKYFIDNEEFVNLCDFAQYIESQYGIAANTVERRIYVGAKESECIISEKEYRKLKSGTNKGKLKITDTVTGEVFIFNNSQDTDILKMFSFDSVNKGLKSGTPIGGKRSKYCNPCLIERI